MRVVGIRAVGIAALAVALTLTPGGPLAGPTPAAGQGVDVGHGVSWSPSSPAAPSVAASPTELRLQLQAGTWGSVSSSMSGLHTHGGVEAGLFRGRAGLTGVAQFGSGGGFDSSVLLLAAAAEPLALGPLRPGARLGVIRYEETESSTGARRHQVAPRADLTLRLPLGPGHAAITAGAWYGSVSGEGIIESASAWAHRISVGYGIVLGS